MNNLQEHRIPNLGEMRRFHKMIEAVKVAQEQAELKARKAVWKERLLYLFVLSASLSILTALFGIFG